MVCVDISTVRFRVVWCWNGELTEKLILLAEWCRSNCGDFCLNLMMFPVSMHFLGKLGELTYSIFQYFWSTWVTDEQFVLQARCRLMDYFFHVGCPLRFTTLQVSGIGMGCHGICTEMMIKWWVFVWNIWQATSNIGNCWKSCSVQYHEFWTAEFLDEFNDALCF